MIRQAPSPALGEEAPPFAPSIVEGLLLLFTKALRAQQLYLPNNPMHQRAIEALRGGFASVWQQTDELHLLVMESEFRWEGAVVAHEATRAESLAWVFYKDGIRSLTFLPGFEGDELVRLLGLVQRVRHTGQEEDDLLTLLWEEDFLNLRYRFVDLSTDALPPMEGGEGADPQRKMDSATLADDVRREAAPSVVRMQDFDSTVYFLDEQDMEYIRSSFEAERASDLRRNVLAILYDIYEQEPVEAIRTEVAGVVDTLAPQLLAVGDFRSVAYLVAEAQRAADGGKETTPAQRALLLSVTARLGQPAAVAQLLQALDDARTPPPPEELDALFEVIGSGALATVLGWLGKLQSGALREGLERAASRLASSNVSELVRLIASPDKAIALQAARRAGDLRTAAAVAPLGRLLQGDDAQLRLAAASALAEIASAGALQQLERAVEDPHRDVRVTAVRVLGAKGHRAALPLMEHAVRDKSLRDADLTEKMAYYEAYGMLAGEGGVSFLDGILNGRGFLGRRDDAETRACAALALGKIGSGEAFAALRRAGDDKELVVRNAVGKALRGGSA